tara:strand:+ start:3419 stop:3592 length:174 start_codon:yes stop_codon:yes gene_type:complete
MLFMQPSTVHQISMYRKNPLDSPVSFEVKSVGILCHRNGERGNFVGLGITGLKPATH